MRRAAHVLLPLLGAAAIVVAGCAAETTVDDEAEEAETPVARQRAVPVWLDVDPATGLPDAEVDDGLMMIQAFHSPEVEVVGISVVFGNTSLDNGMVVGREIVERFGPEGMAVHAGAASPAELGVETPAVRAMAEALVRGPLALLAVGPVTNVASLVQLHPELLPRIESVVAVAGRRVDQRFRLEQHPEGAAPFPDFNFEQDPAAMQVLLDSGVRLVLAPWEVSSKVWIRRADLDRLAERSESGAWIAENTRSWVARWRRNLDVDGFNPFDTLALGWVTHPDLMTAEEVGVWIEEGEDDRQPGATKPYLLVAPEAPTGGPDDLPRALYVHTPAPEFHDLLLSRLAGDAGPKTTGTTEAGGGNP